MVRGGILYGLVVLIFEIISALHGKTFHLGPVIFGLAFSLLLIAAYPERRKLLPEAAMAKTPAAAAPASPSDETEAETADKTAEPEKAS